MAPKNRAEYRKNVADAFASVLTRKGLKWKEEWDAANAAPRNAVTGSPYHGVNRFYLGIIALANGYNDPRWATMTQIMDKNHIYHPNQKWHLQAGSKAVFVEYWYPYDTLEKKQINWKDYRKLPREELDGDRYVLRVRYTPVFHASMIDGIPPLETPQREPQELSEVVERLSKSMGVEILNDGGDRAFYRRREDKIHLPEPSAFHGEYEYNATALHELTHSTGHPSRLNRPTGIFGSKEYAFEELIAEIGSCYMSVNLDIEQMPQHLENHMAYVQNWIEAIEEKPEALVKAIAEAQKAATYMDYHAGLITEREFNAALNLSVSVPENKTEAAPVAPAQAEPVSEALGAYHQRVEPKTWPLQTEFGTAKDFRDYVEQSERALRGDVHVDMPEDTNEYVSALVAEGKILPGDAAYVATNAIQRNGEWERALSGDYRPGPHGESCITLPEAAGMKKLLYDWFPDRNFDVEVSDSQTASSIEARDTFAIYQLKRGLPFELSRDLRFSSLQEIAHYGRSVELANYEKVYIGELERGETLDGVYERFNINRPADFAGHSLSVSDIIVTVRDGELTAYYVDGIGFKELPELSRELSELESYVGSNVDWNGNMYEIVGMTGNRLVLQSVNDDYHLETTLAELRLEVPELAGEKMVETNIGKMPLQEYQDIVAQQAGYDSYEDMRKEGVMLQSDADSIGAERKYQEAEIFGKPVLYSAEKISRDDIPEGWFKYDLRADAEAPTKPVSIEHNVIQSFAGSILSPERINIPELTGYRRVGRDLHISETSQSVSEFTYWHDEYAISDTTRSDAPQKDPSAIQRAAEQACACYCAELSQSSAEMPEI